MSSIAASLELVPQPPPTPKLEPPPWSLPARLVFRFFFCWLALIIEPFPFRDLPGFRWIGWLADKALDKPFTWTSQLAAQLIGYHGTMESAPNGSGDQLVSWIDNLGCILFALIVTIVWSAFDRRQRRYDRLYAFIRLWTRYYLAFVLLPYGFEKLFVLQMPPPSMARLEEPFGNFSPMGLLWTFMGASPAYERFSGFAELLGSVLLLSRRTQLLGALTTAGVMLNVVLLNLCYDVPVKILSSTLLMMALFLVVQDLPRLSAVLLRRAPPPPEPEPRRSRRWRWSLLAAELVAGLLVVVPHYLQARQLDREFYAVRPPQPIEGTWTVERQVLDGRELPPLLTETQRWHTLTVWRMRAMVFAQVQQVDDATSRLRLEVDEGKQQLTLSAKDQPKRVVAYSMADAEHLTIADDKRQFVLELRKLPPRPYLLTTRGFHWVNEEPFQR